MKLFVQWATKHPRGWTEIDSSEWAMLAKKPAPVGKERITDKLGWLNDVCVQGMCAGPVDHVAIEEIGDAVCMTLWNDDPEDYEPSQYFARVTTFYPLKPDPELGGAINTDIESVFYAGPDKFKELKARDFADAEVRPWSEFTPPPEAITRHGIWLTDKLADKHLRIRRTISWREWDDVPCQRDLGRWSKAKGTVTYYQRGTDYGGSGDDAYMGSPFDPAAGQNFRLTKNSTTVNDITRDILLGTTEISFAWTTESGEPNNADWPTGDYRAQIDINGLEGGDVTCKTIILQVTSTGSIRETFGTSSQYTSTGLKLFTVSDKNPGAGATTDRYQIRVEATNAHAHQARLITLGTRSTDSYADGPWTAAITHEGAATVKGVGAASGIGALTLLGEATVAGEGSVNATAGLILYGTSVIVGTGSVSASGEVTAELLGAAIVTGVGTVSGTAKLVLSSASSVTGIGAVSATAGLVLSGIATVVGVGSVSATGTTGGVLLGAAIITGAGSTTGIAKILRSGEGTATGVGSATGTATVVTEGVLGAAIVTGIGDSSATAGLTLSGAANVAGIGVAAALAVLIVVGMGTATGVGSVSATGAIVGIVTTPHVKVWRILET